MTEDADIQILKAGVARIERDLERNSTRLEAYLTQHSSKHDSETASYNSHLLQSSESMSRSARHDVSVAAIDTRLETIESWRFELLGAMRLVKLAFGTSILSALVTILTLFALLNRTA